MLNNMTRQVTAVCLTAASTAVAAVYSKVTRA